MVGGLILIVALVGTNYIVGKLDNLPRFHRLFTPAPAVIVKDGKYLGDFASGERIAQSGRGKQFNDDPRGDQITTERYKNLLRKP